MAEKAPLRAQARLALRERLCKVYEQAAADGVSCRAELDAAAAPYLQAAEKLGFAQEDFLLLRQADTANESRRRAAAEAADLEQEESLIVKTAAQACGVRVLEIYLRRALARYRAALREEKIPPQEADRRIQRVCLRAVRGCLAQFIRRHNWGGCASLLRHYRAVLGETFFNTYAQLTEAGFAQDQARAAWERTEEILTPHQRKAAALALLQDGKSAPLEAWVREQVDALYKQELVNLYRAQSGVYGALAAGEAADLSVLEADEAATAAQLRAVPEQGPVAADCKLFNRLFADASAPEIKAALRGGKLGARDYFILMREAYARSAGDENRPVRLLLHGLRLWCGKQNLPERACEEAVYEVSRATEPLQAAQEVKKIFSLQENFCK